MSDDLKLDADGRVVAARDIYEGETLSIPRAFYEQIVRQSGGRAPDGPRAAPGDVQPDGRIVIAGLGGMPGYPVAHGTVWVTEEQAAQAAAYGWVRNGGMAKLSNPPLVMVTR